MVMVVIVATQVLMSAVLEVTPMSLASGQCWCLVVVMMLFLAGAQELIQGSASNPLLSWVDSAITGLGAGERGRSPI